MGGKREHTCKSGRGCFQQCLRTVLFFQGALRHFGLSRRSPQLVVKAFVTHTKKRKKNNKRKKHKAKQGKKHMVIKSVCFAHSSFQKERVKQGPLIKKREVSFPPPADSEYIPCEQMAEFPVLALWGNENAELLFSIFLFWRRGVFVVVFVFCFFFSLEIVKFGNKLFKIYSTGKGFYFKIGFFLFYIHVNISGRNIQNVRPLSYPNNATITVSDQTCTSPISSNRLCYYFVKSKYVYSVFPNKNNLCWLASSTSPCMYVHTGLYNYFIKASLTENLPVSVHQR